MKTGKEFYEMHHPIDVGIETKEGCIKMMEGYANYVLGIYKNLQQSTVISSVCECGGSSFKAICSGTIECRKCGKVKEC